MATLITFFLFALLVSFVCSLMEAVILSISRAHIAVLVNKGSRSGKILKGLKSKIDTPLSAILTLNTIANTVGAAGVGAQTLKVFGNQWVALVSALLTFSILVFSEIIPKTFGAVHWKKLSAPAAYIIKFMIFITFPFVLFLKEVSRLFTGKNRPRFLTREDLLALTQISETEGIIRKKEAHIINNLLRLSKIKVADILTPRSVVHAFQKDETVGEITAQHNPIRFSKIPIYDQDIDNIVGMVYRSKILEYFFKKKSETRMEEIMQPIYVIPESKSVAKIMDEFIKRQEHIFLVVDEYGGTEGIVTLEDSIETLLGVEIVDELDTAEDMRALARNILRERKAKRENSE